MSSGISSWLLESRRRKVGEAVRGRVLDVGFGTGISQRFYPTGVRVVGIDASRGMLEVARRSRATADLAVMDAERLAFADQTFDSVAFNLCLPGRATRTPSRTARSGSGMVHVLPVALVQEALNPILVAWQADHFNRRTEDVVRRAGVEVLSVERWLVGIFTLIIGRTPAV